MPVDDVAWIGAQSQKVRRVELLGFVNMKWNHMMNLQRLASTTSLAHRLPC